LRNGASIAQRIAAKVTNHGPNLSFFIIIKPCLFRRRRIPLRGTGHRQKTRLLSSGLYRRLWNFTRSVLSC
jgi:hypothetical protein